MTTLHYILIYITIAGTTGLALYSHKGMRQIIDNRGLKEFSLRVRKILIFTVFVIVFPLFVLSIPYVLYLKIINWRLSIRIKRLRREVDKAKILMLLGIIEKLSK